MRVLHISAECYPAAKAGGLGDVVGALPIYLNKAKVDTGVIIPKYHTKWILQQNFQEIYRGHVRMHDELVYYSIEQLQGDQLPFPFYVVNIPGKFDRPGVYLDASGYGYRDETERAICFQQAVLQWVTAMPKRPAILHCHDHHTGLIPFFVKHCPEFKSLANMPTIFTIHNGEYHGAFSWRKMYLLPLFNANARGLLDWADTINPLAAGIKSCWKLTTVSPSYLDELRQKSNGLEWLINHESGKSIGILNGIDANVWNPATDPFLVQKYTN
ncbi:MAG: glycogen synthase, partial [Saprospiraceae bacterium]